MVLKIAREKRNLFRLRSQKIDICNFLSKTAETIRLGACVQ